jgi:Leucine-rich repeat (LRR) protein
MLTEMTASLFVGLFDTTEGEDADAECSESVVDLTNEEEEEMFDEERNDTNFPAYFPSYVRITKNGRFRFPKDLQCVKAIEISNVGNDNLARFCDWLEDNSSQLTQLEMVILDQLHFFDESETVETPIPWYIQVVEELVNVKSLKSLHINQCYYLSGELFTAIRQMTQLEAFSFTNYEEEYLDHGMYELMVLTLRYLKDLRRLDLSFYTNDSFRYVYESESLLLALWENKKLEYLNLYSSDMSLVSIRKFPYLPCLKVLNLGRNRIDDVDDDQPEHDADTGDEFQREMYTSGGCRANCAPFSCICPERGGDYWTWHQSNQSLLINNIPEEANSESDSDDDDEDMEEDVLFIHPRGGYEYNRKTSQAFLYIARRCPALESLFLGDGMMNRERVDFLIPALSKMTNLKELYLHNNRTDLPFLDYWRGGGINSRMMQLLAYHLPKDLKVLTLYGNDFEDSPNLRRYLPPNLENNPFDTFIGDHNGNVARTASRKLKWLYTAEKICEYATNGVIEDAPVSCPINALENLCANDGCLRLVVERLQNFDYSGCIRNWLEPQW